MLLLDLANELLICIAEQLAKEADINAFAQANRQLCYLLNPVLYRRNIQQSKSSGLFWASRNGKKTSIERLLEEGANVEVERLLAEGDNRGSDRLLEDIDGETVGLGDCNKIKPLALADGSLSAAQKLSCFWGTGQSANLQCCSYQNSKR